MGLTAFGRRSKSGETPTERQIGGSLRIYRLLSMASDSLECPLLSDTTPPVLPPHSHSIVPGGLLVMS